MQSCKRDIVRSPPQHDYWHIYAARASNDLAESTWVYWKDMYLENKLQRARAMKSSCRYSNRSAAGKH